ncbi:hypothetical protein HELRODRAFT_167798 [Helobdella robusta]|uniref:THAP-type domain-containing protein n=1 Tax=Helobdella robusta TaxID=6412 RepID=T1EZT7_HELRO|nr:hypothetical protein HELRODRAFT_167798 [Helobdella robusta]ESO09966.1 hypothetical protein HELRODRAFT_167798 [Helobdella robusta]
MGLNCRLPNCTSRYTREKIESKRHFFKVTSNKLHPWNEKLKRIGHLKLGDVICDLHFEEKYILKNFSTTVNGTLIEIERGKWSLTEDAIPSKHLSVSGDKKIKDPKKNKPKNKLKKNDCTHSKASMSYTTGSPDLFTNIS